MKDIRFLRFQENSNFLKFKEKKTIRIVSETFPEKATRHESPANIEE